MYSGFSSKRISGPRCFVLAAVAAGEITPRDAVEVGKLIDCVKT